jgi:hypothetical protein
MLYAFSLTTKADKVARRRLIARGQVRRLPDDRHPRAGPRAPDRYGRPWARHFPLIVTAAPKLRQQHFVDDGETVVHDKDGVSDFIALQSRKHDKRAQLYAFDKLAGDSEDHRAIALSVAVLISRRDPQRDARLSYRKVKSGNYVTKFLGSSLESFRPSLIDVT